MSKWIKITGNNVIDLDSITQLYYTTTTKSSGLIPCLYIYLTGGEDDYICLRDEKAKEIYIKLLQMKEVVNLTNQTLQEQVNNV